MNARLYPKYLLVVLLIIQAFNYVDRLALGLVLQDIKIDLSLSDTQLGVLTGLAFALFYSVMGIPIARWADRGNRVTIITATTAIWSAAVALCGAAGSFLQLLLIRIGVAIGEAGCIPPAHSLIADHFTRAERPRAVGIYMLGVPLGMLIGFFAAGWLNELYGWRVTFMVLGLPGLGLAILAASSLREPRVATPSLGAAALSTRAAATLLWGNATFRQLLLAYSVVAFFGHGISQWKAAFFIRSYGLGTGELGTWFALIWGVGGFIGTYWGGELATRRAAHNERLQLKSIAVAYGGFGLISCGIYLSPNPQLALALMTISAVGISAANGPLFATFQTLVPSRLRATAVALIYLSANLIGLGLGPIAAGALSDLFRPWAGEESLRYALLVLCPGYLWCAWHLWRAGTTVTRDVNATRAMEDTAGAARHP